MKPITVRIDNEEIAKQVGSFENRIRKAVNYVGREYEVVTPTGRHWVDRKHLSTLDDITAELGVKHKTTVKCGYFCKHNFKGDCSLPEILIDEDRTCSNYVFDAWKANCGCCEHHDYENNKCLEDGLEVDMNETCHNGKYNPV